MVNAKNRLIKLVMIVFILGHCKFLFACDVIDLKVI